MKPSIRNRIFFHRRFRPATASKVYHTATNVYNKEKLLSRNCFVFILIYINRRFQSQKALQTPNVIPSLANSECQQRIQRKRSHWLLSIQLCAPVSGNVAQILVFSNISQKQIEILQGFIG